MKNSLKGGAIVIDETKIIKVRKNQYGEITDVMLQDGNVYTAIEYAIIMSKDNVVKNINMSNYKNDMECLISNLYLGENNTIEDITTFE